MAALSSSEINFEAEPSTSSLGFDYEKTSDPNIFPIGDGPPKIQFKKKVTFKESVVKIFRWDRLRRRDNPNFSELMYTTPGILIGLLAFASNTFISWQIFHIKDQVPHTFSWKVLSDFVWIRNDIIRDNCKTITVHVQVPGLGTCEREETFTDCVEDGELTVWAVLFLTCTGWCILNDLLVVLFLAVPSCRGELGCWRQSIIRLSLCTSWWINTWLAVPILFNASKLQTKLEFDMRKAIDHSRPPKYVTSMWHFTQKISSCCGINNFKDWRTDEEIFPVSCCSEGQCEAFPGPQQVFPNGCLPIESATVSSHCEKFIAGFLFKLVVEAGLFWTLFSVLEKFTLPNSKKLNSSVRLNGFEIKAHGIISIQSVASHNEVLFGIGEEDNHNLRTIVHQTSSYLTVSLKNDHILKGFVKVMPLGKNKDLDYVNVDISHHDQGVYIIYLP